MADTEDRYQAALEAILSPHGLDISPRIRDIAEGALNPSTDEDRTRQRRTADCFLHGFYKLDENGAGCCPVCGLGGQEA